MTTGRRQLAEAFNAWMSRNGYTQTDVAAMGGPSTTTQSKVVNTDDPISRQTMKQLDTVMGWPGGTAAGIVRGEAPPDPGAEAVGAVVEDDDALLYARPDGLTDGEWQKIKTHAGEFVRWQIEQAMREQ